MTAYDYIRDGDAIYARSFAIIRAEADLARFGPDEADLAVRMIHACGLVEAAASFRFSPGFVGLARAALRAGAPILCDAEMVAHGVTRARLPAGNPVVCTLRDPRTPELAAGMEITRSAAALELWRDRLEGAVVVIGNAPTALFRLLEMLDAGAPRPAAVIGMPVGFVGAAESKDALAATDLPHAVVLGRLGGSAMAAAAVNALARAGDMSGRLVGVGTGPGDPELLTLKAVRALAAADVVAHFAKAGRRGNARTTVEGYLRADAIELPLLYPVTTEIDRHETGYVDALAGFFTEAAAAVEAHLAEGRTVAVLSEGDPLFYGSYMHLHVRLAPRWPAEVIPGITAMSGCWSQAGLPLVQGDEVLSVLPGTLPEAELARRLADSAGSVIMKVGRNLPVIRRALAATGKLARAVYVERGTMARTVTTPLIDKADDLAPYFSIVLVPGWEGRP